MSIYTKAVPEDSFLGHYLHMMSGQETPEAYDFWCGIWILSTLLGRDVIVERPRAPIRMNWYIALVAESGVTRKSSAVRLAREFVGAVSGLRVTFVDTKTTPEKLASIAATTTTEFGHAHLALCVPEMVTFFGTESYLRAMPGLLTDWYDCPAERSGGGTLHTDYTIKDLYPTLLTASTPTWLIRAINPDIIEGGFTSRCIFVHEEKRKKRIPWPEELDGQVRTRAVSDCEQLCSDAARYPNIRLHPGALARFKSWYNTRSESVDAFRSSFESREDAHILRLAGMLARNAKVYDIESVHLGHATRIIAAVKDSSARLFNNPAQVNELVLGIDKMRQVLISHGMAGVPQQTLTQAVKHWLRADQCLIALEIMRELEMVTRFDSVKLNRTGRPATIWRANKGLVGGGDTVMQIVKRINPEDAV